MDIQEAIERIDKHAARGRAVFETDELVQNWIVHHLQIIGEAVRALPKDFRDAHREVPWPNIIGMRNVLVHNYFGVDIAAVWAAVEHDLPELKKHVAALLAPER